jgi:hypothetical protein
MKVARYSMVVLLLLLVLGAWAEERRYEVTITLTTAQINAVNNARGRGAVIEFTATQLETIQKVLPRFDFTEVTLATSNLNRDGQVLLVLLAPDDLHGRIKMDPQPSP